MQHDSTKESAIVGLTLATITSVIPAWMLDTATKVLLAAVTALVSGLCYRLGTDIAARLGGRDDSK